MIARRFSICFAGLAVVLFFGLAPAAPVGQAWAQSDASNLIMSNPLGAFFGSLSVRYERRINDGTSLYGDVRYRNRPAFGVYAGWLQERGYDSAYSMVGHAGAHRWLDDRALEGWYAGGGPIAGYTEIDNPDKGIDTATMMFGLRGRIGYRWISEWISFGPNLSLGYSEVIERTADEDGAIRAVSGVDAGVGLGLALAF